MKLTKYLKCKVLHHEWVINLLVPDTKLVNIWFCPKSEITEHKVHWQEYDTWHQDQNAIQIFPLELPNLEDFFSISTKLYSSWNCQFRQWTIAISMNPWYMQMARMPTTYIYWKQLWCFRLCDVLVWLSNQNCLDILP